MIKSTCWKRRKILAELEKSKGRNMTFAHTFHLNEKWSCEAHTVFFLALLQQYFMPWIWDGYLICHRRYIKRLLHWVIYQGCLCSSTLLFIPVPNQVIYCAVRDDEKELPSFDGSFIPSLPLLQFLPGKSCLSLFTACQLYSPFRRKCSPGSKHQRLSRRFCCQVEFPARDTIKWWPRVCKLALELRKHGPIRNRPIWCSLCYRWANSEASNPGAKRGACGSRRCRPAIVAGNSEKSVLALITTWRNLESGSRSNNRANFSKKQLGSASPRLQFKYAKEDSGKGEEEEAFHQPGLASMMGKVWKNKLRQAHWLTFVPSWQ